MKSSTKVCLTVAAWALLVAIIGTLLWIGCETHESTQVINWDGTPYEGAEL